MKQIKTQLDLDARVEDAWALLSDFATWSSWNPVIPKIQAEPRAGGRVEFEIRVDPKRPMNLRAKFRTWEEGRAIAWAAGVPGLFAGEHYLRLQPLESGTCRLTHGEDFRGLVPALLFTPKRLGEIEAAYARMNEAFASELARRAGRGWDSHSHSLASTQPEHPTEEDRR